jgi:F0F1-type ATP synthase assembly protein I
MDAKSIRQIMLSGMAYSLSSIIAPLLFLGVPAYFLDRYFQTKPILMLIAVFFSFIITNILLFKKVSKINRMIAEQFPPLPASQPVKDVDGKETINKEL